MYRIRVRWIQRREEVLPLRLSTNGNLVVRALRQIVDLNGIFSFLHAARYIVAQSQGRDGSPGQLLLISDEVFL